jgi:hypothetical protein
MTTNDERCIREIISRSAIAKAIFSQEEESFHQHNFVM